MSDLKEMADTIRDQALAEANWSSGKFPNWTGRAGVTESSTGLREISRGLARDLVKSLAANDQRVVAVYGCQQARPAASEQRPGLSPGIAIHLLIVVTAPSAALLALIASLTRVLAASLRALHVFPSSAHDLFVNANVITEHELRIGLGLIGLLSAMPARPVKLWEREVEARSNEHGGTRSGAQ